MLISFVNRLHRPIAIALWCNILIFVGIVTTAFYNQTTYFYNQKRVSPLLLFHMNRASERNVIPTMERYRATAIWWSSLRFKSTRYYPKHMIFENSLLLWYYLGLFIVCLAAVMIQITVTKQTRLVIHSSKRKGRLMLYKWSLGITILVRLQGIISLAKQEKP